MTIVATYHNKTSYHILGADLRLRDCLCYQTTCLEDVYAKHYKKDRTALHLAVWNDRPRPWCIRILIEAGADIEAIDEDAATPISLASRRKDCTSIEILDTLGARTGHLDIEQRKNIENCYECKFCYTHKTFNSICTLI